MEDIYGLSDVQLLKRIGSKLRRVRLHRNITQQSLADSAEISISSLKKIEAGEIGTFNSLLRVLRTLDMLETISALFEDDRMSPNEYYQFVNETTKHLRKRAAGQLKTEKEESEW